MVWGKVALAPCTGGKGKREAGANQMSGKREGGKDYARDGKGRMEIRGGGGFPPPHPVAMRGREPCSSPGQWGKWNDWKEWENGINNGERGGEKVRGKGEGMSGKRRDGGMENGGRGWDVALWQLYQV